MGADPQQKQTNRLSTAQVVALLGVTSGRVRQLAARGDLGANKVGGVWSFSADLVRERASDSPVDRGIARGGGTEVDDLRYERDFLVAEGAALRHRSEIEALAAKVAVLEERLRSRELELAAAKEENGRLRTTVRALVPPADSDGAV